MSTTSNLIYEPAGRAREYAPLACNVYRGCDHMCVYCYAPSATQRTRTDFAASATRGADFVARLDKEAARHQLAGLSGQVLLSFTTDPYQTLDLREQVTRRAIQSLHKHGFSVCTLTKGGTRALRDLDLFGAGDAFATTMTLLDPEQSAKWEPGAASPADRMEAIRRFHAAGITTWVSLEPVLDPASALEIIRQTHDYVDLYKVGKLNYHPRAKEIDWCQFALDASALLDGLGKRYYVKNDLAAFLPGGYAPGALTHAEVEALFQAPAPCVPAPTISQLSMF